MILSMLDGRFQAEVAESTIELAEMAIADYGTFMARTVLRELIPTLSLKEACLAVAEAARRLDNRSKL